MTNRRSAAVLFGASVLGLALTVPMLGSSVPLNTTRLTFSGPVRLPGVTLIAGSYLFERVDPTIRNVIVVRSGDRARVFFMAQTLPAERPAGLAPGARRHARRSGTRRGPAHRSVVSGRRDTRARFHLPGPLTVGRHLMRRGRPEPVPPPFPRGRHSSHPVDELELARYRQSPAATNAAQKNGCVLRPLARRSRSTVRLAWCTASAVDSLRWNRPS